MMIDLPKILIGIPLKKHGKGYMHVDHDSLKFYQFNGKWFFKWYSRNQSGDVIDFLRLNCGKSYNDALAMVKQHDLTNKETIKTDEYINDDSSQKQWQNSSWSRKARKLIYHAQAQLFKYGDGIGAPLEYLTKERGLKIQTIEKARLGWMKEKDRFPAKHVIPVYNSDRKIIRVRFRHWKDEKTRYRCMAGSDGKSPYPIGVKKDVNDQIIVICESELDGLLIHQETNQKVGVLALGTAIAADEKIIKWLKSHTSKVILALDNDQAGIEASNQWQRALFDKAIKLKYEGKDPGTYFDLIGKKILINLNEGKKIDWINSK